MISSWPRVHIDDLKADTPNAIAMGPFGSRIRTENFVSDGVPVIRGSNLGAERFFDEGFVYLTEDKADEVRSANAFALDIVITHRGTLGQVGIIPQMARYPRYVVSQSQLKVTIDPQKADPYFVFYYLRSPEGRHQLLANASQTGVPAIAGPSRAVRAIQVPYPPLHEQQAIASILGVLDDKIELNRRVSETVEAIAQALFKSWFVHFDPVRAKSEGQWKPGQTLPGFPGYLHDSFPDSLVESEMGGIPHGWKVAVLPEIIQVNPTRTLRKGEWAPYVDMANMPTRTHSPDRVIERPFGSGVRFMNGDTLLARITPSLENGKTAFVDFLNDGEIGWGSTEFIVLRPKPPFPEEYAYCLARSEGFRHFAIQSMTGSSGRQRVPPESLSHYRLAVAPRPIVEAFGRIVRPLFERAKAATNESRTLAALRDALLPKLISGHLRVKDAERFLEERGL